MSRTGPVIRIGILLSISFCLTASGAGRRAGAPAPVAWAGHEVLVKFRPHAGPKAREAVQEQMRARRHRTFRSGAQHWKLPGTLTTEQAIERLRRHPLVEYVEPNHLVSIEALPDDPLLSGLWGLRNTGQAGGVPGADIDAERAWDAGTGSRAVLVAVIDTGIDYTHPDLEQNIWTNDAEIPDNNIDDDRNGYVDDVHGYNFHDGHGDPMDDNGHGTHVAGTIGAVGNNAAGVAGAAWAVTLLPLKFLGSGGTGTTSDAVAAIDYAADRGADVINNSWGGGGFSRTLLEAIERTHAAGALFVVAAGNDGTNTDSLPTYPAGYDVPNVISVAATDMADTLAAFSNFGRASVDLAAPGVAILSTFPGGQYRELSGTSMAAPHVSGVAALMRSLSPRAPPELLRLKLMETVDPVPGLADFVGSGGRLNAYSATGQRDVVAPGQVEEAQVVRVLSNSIEMRWVATGDDGSSGQAASYDVRYASAPLDPLDLDAAPRAAGAPRPSTAGETDTMELAGLSAGTTWHVAVRARDEWGNAGPAIFLEATTLPNPAFASSPGALSFDVPPGASASGTLTVRNAGEGSLDWSIVAGQAAARAGVAPAPAAASFLEKDDPDPRLGEPAARSSGGPDRFGYRFDDSREPSGPSFQWAETGSKAEVLESLTGDDQVSEPLPLGFLFPFYGGAYTTVRVSTNGWISLSPASAFPVNQPLPSAAAPALMIAPFWDDLDFGGQPRARVVRREGAWIVEYRDVGRYRGAGRCTFQAELRATGEIRLRYLVVDGAADSATVGIQDAAADSLQMAFNASYVQPELEVRVRPQATWWSAAPLSGRLLSGEEQQVTVDVRAAGLTPGDYESAVLMRTNDPLRPVMPHPLVLRVAGEPRLIVEPAAIDFGDVEAGLAGVRTLRLANTGTARLDLELEASDPFLTVTDTAFSLSPGESRLVLVTWRPGSPGLLDAVLTIAGPLPSALPLRGSAVEAAGLTADPAVLHEEVSGGTITRAIRLTNTTAQPLELSITADPGEAPVGAEAPSFRQPGEDVEAALPSWNRPGTLSTPVSIRSPRMRAETEATADAFGVAEVIPDGGFERIGQAAREIEASPAPIEPGGVSLEAGSMPGWIRVAPGSAVVPPGGSADLLVTLDADAASSGLYRGAVLVQSELPALAVRLPVSLAARPVPRMRIQGGPVRVASVKGYASRGATTEHVLRLPVPPEGGGMVDLEVEGSYWSWDGQSARLDMEGQVELALRELPADCSRGRRSLAVDAPTLARIAADGVAAVRVTNEENVFTYCPANLHHVALTYRGASGTIDFPQVFAGERSEGSLEVSNMGETDLVVQASSGDASFHVIEELLVVPPGHSGLLKVQFSPAGPGAVAAALHLSSNDPLNPETTVALRGRAVLPPLAAVSPESVEAVLSSGSTATRTLTLSNLGESDLTATLSVRAAGALTTGATGCSPDRLLVSEFDNGTLASVDLATGAATRVAAGLSGPNRGIVPLEDGVHALVVESYSGELSRVNILTGQVATVARGLGFPTSVVVTPDETAAFVTEAGRSSIARVSLPDGEVTRVPASFSFPNAVALDRDGSHLFLAAFGEGAVYRVDPVTGQATTVAQHLDQPNDLALDPQGETLYVVETPGRIAAVDLLSGTVTRLVTGLADPVGIGADANSIYIAEYVSSRILRIDRVTGSAATLAYGLIGPVGAAPAGSCARFATVQPRAVHLAPGEHAEVFLGFETGDLPAETHRGVLQIAGNDPRLPSLDVPLRLTVLPAPDIDVRGEIVRIDSAAAFGTRGAFTGHALPMSAPAAGPAVLELEAEGDFGADDEQVEVHGEDGALLMSAGRAGSACGTVRSSWVVPEVLLEAWAQDGVARLTARNGPFVDPACGVNEHRLRLSYQGRADGLDFGTVFTGSTRTRRIVVFNRGSDVLSVSARTTLPGFVVPVSLSVAPRSQAGLEVTFTPAGSADLAGDLVLESNDPDEPELRVPLRARAAGPPRLAVAPGSLDLSASGGEILEAPLTLSNLGDSDLAWSARAVAGERAAEFPSFEELPPSPVPLTAMAGEPSSGSLYAMEQEGSRVFRFDAAARAWQERRPAPEGLGPARGAALLDGRLYTTHSGDVTLMGVYDIAADAWSTIANPLRSAASHLASDGARHLYLGSDIRMVRLDPETSEITSLPPAPFPLGPFGGMRASLGMLYAHQGGEGFAVFDISAGFWALLPRVPGDAGLGASFDPVERTYHAPGLGTPYLFHFDLASSRWQIHRIPWFNAAQGGVAWLPVPEPAVYVVQGGQGTGFGRLVSPPSFVATQPASGRIAPGAGSVTQVGVHAGALFSGVYAARLQVDSNDPDGGQVQVPLRLQVEGLPRLEVRGEPVRRVSFLSWSGREASTRHTVPLTGRPGGPVVVELYAEGDFDARSRVATLSIEGMAVGVAVRDGGSCEAARGRFVLPPEVAEAVFADGVAEVTVTNYPEVGESCPVHRHTVVLTYPLRADRIDFGEVRLGRSAARTVQILNSGTAPMDVSLSAGDGAFHADPPALTLPPDAATAITVTFIPDARGAADSVLWIDAGGERRGVALAAVGYEAPRAVAEPDVLRVALPPGGAGTRTLGLRNAGERPLAWALATRYGGGRDEGGYAWRDSDQPGGPAFSWIDIAGKGTSLPLFRDDETRGPVPLGFSFPFYGRSFGSVNVSTNGFLSFTSLQAPRGGGGTLPGDFAPENLIAPLWTDLDFNEERRAWRWSDGERFIVQYDGVAVKSAPGSSVTFQVILHRSGRILFQYLSIPQPPGTVTIGTQNDDRSIGLLVSATPAYLHDGLAVEIAPAAWLVTGARAGELEGDSALQIPILFDAAAAGEGDHSAKLSFNTNDPVRPAFEVPVALHVGEIALDTLDIDPDTLHLASRGRGVQVRLQLPAGLDPLQVDVPSLRLNGTLAPAGDPVELTDESGDGVPELLVRFDRAALEQLLAPGDNQVVLTGEVRDITWFRGAATVRALGPRVTRPNGGEVLLAGTVATVTWDAAPWSGASYRVELSRDGGQTWEPLAPGAVTGTSLSWIVHGEPSTGARIRVTALDSRGPVGDDSSDAPFTLAVPRAPRLAIPSPPAP
jgi:subtilisin family serine protease